jgi:hypothetical protein
MAYRRSILAEPVALYSAYSLYTAHPSYTAYSSLRSTALRTANKHDPPEDTRASYIALTKLSPTYRPSTSRTHRSRRPRSRPYAPLRSTALLFITIVPRALIEITGILVSIGQRDFGQVVDRAVDPLWTVSRRLGKEGRIALAIDP